MELSKQILDFYDKLLDGNGVAKMISVGYRKGLRKDNIRMAAKIVYDKHMDGQDKFLAHPLSVAKKVYEIAKNEEFKKLQKIEVEASISREELLKRIVELEQKLKPFSQKLFEWFSNEIYFY